MRGGREAHVCGGLGKARKHERERLLQAKFSLAQELEGAAIAGVRQEEKTPDSFDSQYTPLF